MAKSGITEEQPPPHQRVTAAPEQDRALRDMSLALRSRGVKSLRDRTHGGFTAVIVSASVMASRNGKRAGFLSANGSERMNSAPSSPPLPPWHQQEENMQPGHSVMSPFPEGK